MLEDLRNRITKLIALYEGEKQRADGLADRLASAEASLDSAKKQIIELERQIDNLKLMSAFGAGSDNAVAKERVNRLIREIDKCIALMEN